MFNKKKDNYLRYEANLHEKCLTPILNSNLDILQFEIAHKLYVK